MSNSDNTTKGMQSTGFKFRYGTREDWSDVDPDNRCPQLDFFPPTPVVTNPFTPEEIEKIIRSINACEGIVPGTEQNGYQSVEYPIEWVKSFNRQYVLYKLFGNEQSSTDREQSLENLILAAVKVKCEMPTSHGHLLNRQAALAESILLQAAIEKGMRKGTLIKPGGFER